MALDLLGSARMPQSSSFQSYYPYGQAANSAVNAEYMWTNQMRGANSGMDHFWFRGYSSTLGRWIVLDPAGLAAVNLANPQTWNRYAYVTNDPLGLSDFLGLATGGPEGCSDQVGSTLPPCITIFDIVNGNYSGPQNFNGPVGGEGDPIGMCMYYVDGQCQVNPDPCAYGGAGCSGGPSGNMGGGGGDVMNSMPTVPQYPGSLHPHRVTPSCMTGALIHNFAGNSDRAGITVATNIAGMVALGILKQTAIGDILPGPGWMYVGVAILWDAGNVAKSYYDCKHGA